MFAGSSFFRLLNFLKLAVFANAIRQRFVCFCFHGFFWLRYTPRGVPESAPCHEISWFVRADSGSGHPTRARTHVPALSLIAILSLHKRGRFFKTENAMPKIRCPVGALFSAVQNCAI
jgi:hypothetical protein